MAQKHAASATKLINHLVSCFFCITSPSLSWFPSFVFLSLCFTLYLFLFSSLRIKNGYARRAGYGRRWRPRLDDGKHVLLSFPFSSSSLFFLLSFFFLSPSFLLLFLSSSLTFFSSLSSFLGLYLFFLTLPLFFLLLFPASLLRLSLFSYQTSYQTDCAMCKRDAKPLDAEK